MSFKKIAILGFIFLSSIAQANELKIIAFQQNINMQPAQVLSVELQNVSASDQVWTAIYMVGEQVISNDQSMMQLQIETQGLLNKANPQQKINTTPLIADHLPLRKKYSLNEFDDIADAIETYGSTAIQNPILTQNAQVRTYAQINQWVPTYTNNAAIRLDVSLQQQEGFRLAGLYVIAGLGELPPEISRLANQNSNLSPEEMKQKFRDIRRAPESSFAFFQSRLMIFFVIAAFFAFLLWGKKR